MTRVEYDNQVIPEMLDRRYIQALMTKDQYIVSLESRIAELEAQLNGVDILLSESSLELRKANDKIVELETPKNCDECLYDKIGCGVQNAILAYAKNQTFTTFSCNSFEPKETK